MFQRIRFAVLLAGVTLAFTALAQPAPDDDQASGPAADPPTRVARLSYLHGAVSFVPAGENDWVEAQLNRPLITGDKLWTDHGSRAELGIGPATLRIDQNTSFDFLNLDDKVAQVELTQGALNLHIRRLYDEQTYEIDTPTLAFVVNRVGDFRIDVLPNGQTTVVTVLQGGGDAYGEGGARFRVEEGQSVTFNDPQLQQYDVASVPHPDEFDTFAQERDHRWDNSASRHYVSEEVIGYEDLDDNGEWNDDAEYGNVWYPSTVAVGWSPYHHGHWGWVGAYGWTWIDDASWGFAPFHYGRWAYVHNRWGWCPGPVAARAVYAPALVAFVGGGVGIGISTGPVGWFPLGPRDVYFPSYRVSEHYFVNLNFSNTRHVDRVVINNYYGGYSHGHVDYEHINYANRNVNGAVVAVPRETFIGARPVAREAIAVNHETFANGGRVSGFAAVAPTRASLASSNVARAAPPAAVMNRQIVAASKPPPPVASFAQRENQLQRNPGQPLTATQLHAPAATAATTGVGANAGHQNVRVVTNTGVPARTAAPTLPARTLGTQATGVQNTGANASANGRGAPNAVTTGHAAPSAVNTGNPNLQGRNTTNLPAVQNGAAANTGNGGRPNANQHLDSSRFAHPQTGSPATGNNAVGAGAQNNGGQPHAVSGPAQSVQHTNTPATNVQNTNRNISTERATEHTPAPNATANHALPQTTQTPKPTTTPYSAERSGVDRGGAHSGAGNPQVQQQQQYHAPTPQPAYHAPPPQPQPQAQQYHAPQQQQQQQYHAPVSTGQIQTQPNHPAGPPPPQPAQHVQPPVNHAPPPAQSGKDKDKDKKDDDKRH